MMLLCALFTLAPQDPLASVLAGEARRAAVVERCSRAVCSVMSMDEPGGGSGVIFDPIGLVLTNFHVVGQPDPKLKPPEPPAPPAEVLQAFRAEHPDDAAGEAAFVARWQDEWRAEHVAHGSERYQNKKVGLADGQLYEGVVLGIDPGSDLAVLRLVPKHEGQRWPFCELGDSDQLLVGETVLAMGNPFLLATDFTPTVTFGIVSGTHRYQEGGGNRMLVYPDCIQVDAPVNPGNSGGPLFNEAGEIVGINGRISIGDRGRVNVGVGFAIAANQIRNFLADLVAGRHAEHGTLDMSAWFQSSRSEQDPRRGVFVQQLFKDSVVAKIGVGLGDEITRFNDIEVRSANQLATMVGVLPADTWVSLWFRPKRDGVFGDEQRGTVRLTKLDTGSSRDGGGDDARLASRAERRLATASLLARMLGGFDDRAGARAWRRVAPDGSELLAIAHGDRLRLQIGALVLVRDGDRGGFAITDGAARDLTVEEAERLRREAACNPLLWDRATATSRLAAALLSGGVHVHGAPAWRFALPGDGECEAWLFADGSPAGFTCRDPLRRVRSECYVRGERLRVVVDRELENGWSCQEVRVGDVDEQWFRRP